MILDPIDGAHLEGMMKPVSVGALFLVSMLKNEWGFSEKMTSRTVIKHSGAINSTLARGVFRNKCNFIYSSE